MDFSKIGEPNFKGLLSERQSIYLGMSAAQPKSAVRIEANYRKSFSAHKKIDCARAPVRAQFALILEL